MLVLCDILTRLKNAYLSHSKTTLIPHTKVSLKILRLCLKEGLVSGFSLNSEESFFKVVLKYSSTGKPAFSKISLLSTPGSLSYIDYTGLCKLASGLSIFFISTDKGFLTNTDCLRFRKGGTVICSVM